MPDIMESLCVRELEMLHLLLQFTILLCVLAILLHESLQFIVVQLLLLHQLALLCVEGILQTCDLSFLVADGHRVLLVPLPQHLEVVFQLLSV